MKSNVIKDTTKEDVCAQCGREFLGDEDEYCRYCGTKRGEGVYDPARNMNAATYGPPVIVTVECKSCGFSWISNTFGTDFSEYCPRCGKKTLEKDEQIDPEFLAFRDELIADAEKKRQLKKRS